MKITVSLELQEQEVQLATELLKTLRLLTEHVTVTKTDNAQERSSPDDLLALLLGVLSRAESSAPQEVADAVAGICTGDVHGAAEVFVTAFELTAFDNRQSTSRSLVPLVEVLAKLREDFRTPVRKALVERVVRHLNKPRASTSDRSDFILHADAFACLVKIDFIPVEGACQTVLRMLARPTTRAAALTMLGKMVDAAASAGGGLSCAAGTLAGLEQALAQQVKEDEYAYDVQWIQMRLKPRAGGVRVELRCKALKGGLFACAYDGATRRVFCGGGDCAVVSWNLPPQLLQQSGTVAEAHELRPLQLSPDPSSSHMPSLMLSSFAICSMDLEPVSGTLLVARMLTSPPPALAAERSALHGFDVRAASSTALGAVTTAEVVSCVRFRGGSPSAFATGEIRLGKDAVVLYDMGASTSLKDCPPLHVFFGHESIVTCLSPVGADLLLSCDDRTIRMWDARAKSGVACWRAHEGTITSVEPLAGVGPPNAMLASSSVDCTVRLWDARMITQPVASVQPDGQPVLKMAVLAGSALAALATTEGLFTCDFSTSLPSLPTTTPAPVVKPWPTVGCCSHEVPNAPMKYYDVKWIADPVARAPQALLCIGDGVPGADVHSFVPQ